MSFCNPDKGVSRRRMASPAAFWMIVSDMPANACRSRSAVGLLVILCLFSGCKPGRLACAVSRDCRRTNSMTIKPTVSLDVISLVASSCGYYRGQIEQRAAHEFAVHVATQRRARETYTAVRSARCTRAGASLQTSTADPEELHYSGTTLRAGTPRWLHT